MHMHDGSNGYRHEAFTAIVLLLLGMMAVAPAGARAAQPAGTAPTVGAIVVDGYECDTGVLNLHAPVTDLPNVPEETGQADYPLAYSYTARYEQGPEISPGQPNVLTPTAEEAPYTGNVFLALTIPTTNANGTGESSGPVASIVLQVSVGYGGAGFGAAENPTDTSTLTFDVTCDEGGPAAEDLVLQLIEVLKRILRDQLNVG